MYGYLIHWWPIVTPIIETWERLFERWAYVVFGTEL